MDVNIDKLLRQREKNMSKFNPYKVKRRFKSKRPFTSTEKYFLSYMAGKTITNPSVAQEWFFDYNIDFCEIMSIFFNEGYIKISEGFDCLPYLKLPQLKEILKANNLSVSGKKAALIDRIANNVPAKKIAEISKNYEPFYVLTPKGIEITKDLVPSATKNLEMEDDCINFILNGQFDAAYRRISSFEITRKIPRGVNTDWNIELRRGLSNIEISEYANFFAEKSDYLSPILNDYMTFFKAVVIFSNMFAIKAAEKLFLRISKFDNSKIKFDLSTEIRYAVSIVRERINIAELREAGYKKIEILGSYDDEDEEEKKCAAHDGKIVNISDAVPGVTVPPFGRNCYCTSISHS